MSNSGVINVTVEEDGIFTCIPVNPVGSWSDFSKRNSRWYVAIYMLVIQCFRVEYREISHK